VPLRPLFTGDTGLHDIELPTYYATAATAGSNVTFTTHIDDGDWKAIDGPGALPARSPLPNQRSLHSPLLAAHAALVQRQPNIATVPPGTHPRPAEGDSKVVMNTVISGVDDMAQLEAALQRIKSRPGSVFDRKVVSGGQRRLGSHKQQPSCPACSCRAPPCLPWLLTCCLGAALPCIAVWQDAPRGGLWSALRGWSQLRVPMRGSPHPLQRPSLGPDHWPGHRHCAPRHQVHQGASPVAPPLQRFVCGDVLLKATLNPAQHVWRCV
jgi:hypothetical protein